MQPMPYQNPTFNNTAQTQWPGSFPQQHQQPQPQQQQPTYCTQQLPPGKFNAAGPRFASTASQSRVAIRQLIVHRQPGNMMAQPTQTNFQTMGPISRPGPMIRTQHRGGIQGSPHQGNMYTGGNNMQGPLATGMPTQANQMYTTVGGATIAAQGTPGGPAQGGMGQYNYQPAALASGQMISQVAGPTAPGSSGPGMLGHGYQQGYQTPSALMNMRQQPQQQQYMSQAMTQGGMIQRPQYIQGPAPNANLSMMNSSQAYSRPTLQAIGQGASSGMMRQRMVMGPGTGSGGQQSAPGQSGSLLTHLPRPMTGVNPQQQAQQQAQQQQGQQQQQQAQQQQAQQQQAQQQQVQQQQQQQQMMHSSSQGMGYPQPPPY